MSALVSAASMILVFRLFQITVSLLIRTKNRLLQIQIQINFQKRNRAMFEKLKSSYKSFFAKEPIEIIFWGQPTCQTFEKALEDYTKSETQERQNQIFRSYRKLKKRKSIYTSLAILHFLNHLVQIQPQVYIPNSTPDVDYEECNTYQEKETLKKYFSFYYSYIKKSSQKPLLPSDIHELELQKVILYFTLATDNIINLIKEKKMIQNCIKHTLNEKVVKMTLSKILRKVSQDLKLLNKFLTNHSELITCKQDFSHKILLLREKYLYITKKISKVKKLNNLMNQKFQYTSYSYATQIQKDQPLAKSSINKKQRKPTTDSLLRSRLWKSCQTEQQSNKENYENDF